LRADEGFEVNRLGWRAGEPECFLKLLPVAGVGEEIPIPIYFRLNPIMSSFIHNGKTSLTRRILAHPMLNRKPNPG
jgi:hypothetical protein